MNVALDVLFVAVWGWGVAGAAIATVIAQAAMTVFLTGYGIIKYPILRFRPGRQSFDRTMLAWGCRFGIPPMLQSSVSSVGSLILQNFMNGFGTQTVAAVTTAYRVDSIVMVPILNLGSGISTLVAQNCGAGQNLRARSIFRVGTAVMAAVSLLLTVLVIPTGGELIALFGAGPEAVSIGDAFFRRIACFYVVYGLANAVRSYLEGMGDVVYSSLAGMASLVCRIILSYTLVVFFANMVIAGRRLSPGCSSSCCTWCGRSGRSASGRRKTGFKHKNAVTFPTLRGGKVLAALTERLAKQGVQGI